ncbi:MAG TPA: DJ-1/PfpI family protein [Candidatus Binataceae bacterium]|nr:DJ-1/PfpI family protein [Candidatus Binataceae bacterium]
MADVKTFGVMLFEGFEVLDVFGPVEAFGILAAAGKHRVVTVAERAGAVTSAQGPKVVADYGFSEAGFGDCPPLDILLIPGGIGTRREVSNHTALEWLIAHAQKAEIVASVCTGAALLAKAGLLDGRRATSNKLSLKWVMEQGPRVNWVREARWVDDGKFSTSSGVSAGIDMALAIIARITDVQTAKDIAIRMEYEWHRDAGWDPFAKIHKLM